jgi:ATP-dependent Clp protease ATP-binding subunit ClpC
VFERYSEKARRAVVVAHIEAYQLCARYVDTGHLLLGAANVDLKLLNRFLSFATSRQSFHDQILLTAPKPDNIRRDLLSIPFSDQSIRALSFSEKEANRIGHERVGIEHLLLGLLCIPGCTAARLLRGRGAAIERIRNELTNVSGRSLPKNGQMQQHLERPHESLEIFNRHYSWKRPRCHS